MKRNNILFLLFSIITFYACKPADVGLDKTLKFPKIAIGKFWVYKVTENNIANGKAFKSDYTLREVVSDTITLGGKVNYFTDVYRRTAEEFEFKKIQTKLLYETEFGLFEKYASNTFHKLKYPVYKNNEWYYDLSKDQNKDNIVKYTETNQNLAYGSKTYDKVFKVLVKNDSTGLYRNKFYELYHPTLGMVYSERIDEAYCQETPTCIGKGIIVSSKIVNKTLIDTN